VKINETQPIGLYKSYSQTAESRVRAGSAGSRKDQVEISDEAKELLGAQGGAGVDRTEKIESLKNQVKAGTYYVDAGKIAEKLLPFFR